MLPTIHNHMYMPTSTTAWRPCMCRGSTGLPSTSRKYGSKGIGKTTGLPVFVAALRLCMEAPEATVSQLFLAHVFHRIGDDAGAASFICRADADAHPTPPHPLLSPHCDPPHHFPACATQALVT